MGKWKLTWFIPKNPQTPQELAVLGICRGGTVHEKARLKSCSKSLLLPCATGWLPISTLAVDWKFMLWREENKYLWTGDMDMDTLPETCIEWLLTEWWMENSPTLFLSVGSQNASNHTFPSTRDWRVFCEESYRQEERPKGSDIRDST